MVSLKEYLENQKLITPKENVLKPERRVAAYGIAGDSVTIGSASTGASNTNQIFSTTIDSSSFPVNTHDTVTDDATNGITFTAPFSRYYRINCNIFTTAVTAPDSSITSGVNVIHRYLPMNIGGITASFVTDASTGFSSSSAYETDVMVNYDDTGGTVLNILRVSHGISKQEAILYLETGESVWVKYNYDFSNLVDLTAFNTATTLLGNSLNIAYTAIYDISEIGADY